MQLQTFQCQVANDSIGGAFQKMPLAKLYVWELGTETLVDLFDEDGDPIDNPVVADSNGTVECAAANGSYDVQITNAAGDYSAPLLQGVVFFDPVDSISVPGIFVNKGGWNATTNSPSLASGVGTSGFAYTVTTAGSTTLDGISTWRVGDVVYFSGSVWKKIVGSDLDALYLAKTGGTLTGALTLAGDPAGNSDATPKSWVAHAGSRSAAVSGGATLNSTYFAKVSDVDASAGTATIVLNDGAADDWIGVRKSDSSSNRITVRNSGATDIAWLSTQDDVALFHWKSGAWKAVQSRILPIQNLFTATGTYTKPPLASRVDVVAIGPGGGGGSGRRSAAASARHGGQAGTAGGLARLSIRASKLGATVAVTVASGGAGGAAASSDSTDGAAGSSASSSSFGSLLIAPGGTGGAAGGATASSAAIALYSLGATTPGATASSATGVPTAASDSAIASTGGNGGGISTGNTAYDGANGAGASVASSSINGGTGGGAGGSAGANGSAVSDTETQLGGSGAGGGGGNSAGAGGAGGAGGSPGGGGGGGGASVNGSASGAGGAGARGEVRVTTYF